MQVLARGLREAITWLLKRTLSVDLNSPPTAWYEDVGESLASDYFANYFIFRGEDGRTVFKSLLALQQPSGDGPLRIRLEANGAYFFDFDTQVLDEMYANHVRKPT